ncbi:phosphopantothenoylcysteine decarboxylase/phosphopantothenate--cysteine ligase [Moraxella macacae 0408225]|uniref:Coenzyme A biosynthesis bifunctional protein CoaBC n=1 Tax=Moraxella macacae 0408225 TaxID=1230338 RepID=L2F5H4_9GAMM|nr:bifunctional phosphopantothenoylcysteine decarboxylase/phosphopantothenate--cysteine ligase CoaBC [Moraxella macacae]ELA08031.1 phosphopantothenoylcysteine decarboxylase/phosphopantothenate--cysteine ligase [Moraxella macacae 0408225]
MKNIILAITGGISAYKSAFFARLLVKNGFNVRVIMTKNAQAFITPLTLQALTGNAVHTELLDTSAELGMGHIELAKWADLVMIAPASANTLAKLSMGVADDLLTTVCLATTACVLICPAMNQQMYAHPALKLNLQTLTDLGYIVIPPESGEQACGDVGEGRLPEPEQLLDFLQNFIAKQQKSQRLSGKHVVITAGATLEAIDPVRYLSNHSTGKMGFALAKACEQLGASVTLVAGNVHLPTPFNVARIDVTSASQMLAVCQMLAGDKTNPISVFIATAAVADYRVKQQALQKIKKTTDALTLDLVKNPDILATISRENPQIFSVGFAAETQDVETYAKGKLIAKQLDMIACNDVSRTDIGFGSDDNAITVFFKGSNTKVRLEKTSKDKIAEQLADLIGKQLAKKFTFVG